MMHNFFTGGLLALTLLCPVKLAAASLFTEGTNDVGQLLATSTSLTNTNTTSSGSPIQIDGTIGVVGASEESTDVDLYSFSLTAGTAFSPVVTSAGGSLDLFDSQLFLFDATGHGLVFNDDISTADNLSQLTFTPSSSGIYYLAITPYNVRPIDNNGQFIFSNSSPTNSVTGSVSALANRGVLTSWSTNTTDFGSYTLSLTGAQLIAVPEPSEMLGSFLLILFSLRLAMLRATKTCLDVIAYQSRLS